MAVLGLGATEVKTCEMRTILKTTLVFLIHALFVLGTQAHKVDKHHEEEAPVCEIEPDYSSTEGILRTKIFKADTKFAAKILTLNETFGLGAGLTYLDNQTCGVTKSHNRGNDPDIVAIQAIALSAKYTGQSEKLANAIVLSFELRCQCSLFTSKERDQMVAHFKGILEDPKEVAAILEFGSDSYFHSFTSGRRLSAAGSSPTISFVCAYCEPSRSCGVLNWC